MKTVENENFDDLVSFSFETNMTESELISNDWGDPFDSVWFKLMTIIVYVVEVLESVIMIAFVVYETNGYNGHYRTLINQLLSHLYGGVGYLCLYSISICFIFLNRSQMLSLQKILKGRKMTHELDY